MSRHVSMPREPTPRWTKLRDAELVVYFRKELETRAGLTAREWDAYNSAWKRTDPEGFKSYHAEVSKRIDMRNAKERLSIADLEQIIAEKRAE